jgi:hypothetical protein
MTDTDFVATTDERGEVIEYYSADFVLKAKEISYWIGVICGGTFGIVFGAAVCLIV